MKTNEDYSIILDLLNCLNVCILCHGVKLLVVIILKCIVGYLFQDDISNHVCHPNVIYK